MSEFERGPWVEQYHGNRDDTLPWHHGNRDVYSKRSMKLDLIDWIWHLESMEYISQYGHMVDGIVEMSVFKP
ncbi:hypothetical protein AC249_AIPGENE21335 [Exaiptasia diaphana]|nr:hypothetical protein AC249_AIPGENE21335 [Exaiptasia diaphana]